MKSHTSTPWQRGPDGFIIKTRPGTTNLVIAEYLSGNPEDADFIIRAVNNHEDLLSYLKIAEEWTRGNCRGTDANNDTCGVTFTCGQCRQANVFKRVIEKVEGKS